MCVLLFKKIIIKKFCEETFALYCFLVMTSSIFLSQVKRKAGEGATPAITDIITETCLAGVP